MHGIEVSYDKGLFFMMGTAHTVMYHTNHQIKPTTQMFFHQDVAVYKDM